MKKNFKTILKIAYAVIFFGILLFIGIMSFAQKNNAPKKEAEVKLKATTYDKTFDMFDDYFSANFGYRSTFINLNNELKYKIFNESGESNVIAGSDGWLFYESALHDYTGEDVLSDEEIDEIAEKIKAIEDTCRDAGTEFVFVCAPDKLEIYGEYMPYYLVEDNSDGNYEKLMAALDEKNVTHVDLKSVLKNNTEYGDIKLYHKLDSHWNNLGASIAYREIMQETDIEATDYSGLSYTARDDFDGDLYEMLFPNGTDKDTQYYFENGEEFYYTSRFKAVDDLLITTENDEQDGNVLLYRDSFGNALYKFFANDFNTATISRDVNYDLTDVSEYDLVVIEIVERNISNLS